MALLDYFRPRWRHPDPDVRAAAVRDMGPRDAERLAALAERDPDGRVRRVAIRKLEDADVLERLASADAEAALRTLAAERAREVLVAAAVADGPVAACEAAVARVADEAALASIASTAAHETVRRAALARLTGDRALRDVVRSAEDPDIRRAALDRIRDDDVLKAVAVGDVPAELALRAVERIAGVDALRALAANRAAAKAVRARARERLPADAVVPSVGLTAARARQAALCAEVVALRRSMDVRAAAAAVHEAAREWQALASQVEPRTDLAEQFAAASAAVLGLAEESERRRAELQRAEESRDAALAARRTLCERVESLREDDADGVAAARARWQALSALDDARAVALARRFEAACEAHAERRERWRAGEAAVERLARLVQEAERLADATPVPGAKAWQAVEQRWAAREAPAGREPSGLAARFDAAAARFRTRREDADREHEAQRARNLEKLEALHRDATEALAGESLGLAAARRLLQAVEAAIRDPGPLPASEGRGTWKDRLSALREEVRRRVAREEDAEGWRRWANVGAQEELIARVETLLASDDLAEGARQLGPLQEEWKRVATASPERSQELWERFRTARNELRRRCDAYMADNLARKQALCAEVAEVGESTDWNETAERIKRAQAAWKAIGPVPARHAKDVWQRFREPCDVFFARRKAHFARVDDERRANAERQRALCEKAEALAESTDWDATTVAIKRLQGQWKETGPAPRDEADALWKRFRAACDLFFDRSRRRDELERLERQRQAEALCERLETTALDGEEALDDAALGRLLDETWGEWLRLDVDADTESEVRDRLEAACARIAAARPDSLRGTRLDPAATAARREKLCVRVEELAAGLAAPPPERSVREMALALRERLAANTIAGAAAGEAGAGSPVAREVERARATWRHLGPLVDDPSRALAERFEAACARVRDANPG